MENNDPYIAVISHARPENVQKMLRLVGQQSVWYVGASDYGAYIEAGALNVVVGGGLCESRNKALRDAFALGRPCVQVSDDLSGIEYTTDGVTSKKISFTEAVRIMGEELSKTPFMMAGTATTPNLYYYHNYLSSLLFVVGDFIYVKPCELLFDENLKLKEDYDYTVQHIKKYRGALRVNGIMPTFKHRTNSGGAVEFRTSERERDAILYLFRKHAGWFRENKTRPNEILMRVPK